MRDGIGTWDRLVVVGVAEQVMISVKFEVSNTFYQAGDELEGTLAIDADSPIRVACGTFQWFTRVKIGEGSLAATDALMSDPVELEELHDCQIEGGGTRSLGFKVTVPEKTPVSLADGTIHGLVVETELIIKLRIDSPLNTVIAREIPLKIIRLPLLRRGILRAIEFPLRRFCARSIWVTAHVELPRRYFTAGETIEATVVVDLEHSPIPIHGISLTIKQVVQVRTVVIEDELMEGPRTVALPQGKRTVVTASTVVPIAGFVPDTDTSLVKVTHAALLHIHCPYGMIVESSIPIQIIHSEAR